jgi:hypothetical protein
MDTNRIHKVAVRYESKKDKYRTFEEKLERPASSSGLRNRHYA